MTPHRIMVETPCEHGRWEGHWLSANKGQPVPCSPVKEDRTVVSPEAIEAAARALALTAGISEDEWNRDYWQEKYGHLYIKEAEAAVSAFIAVQYGIEP